MRIPAYYSDTYAPAEEPLLARLATTKDRLQRLRLIDIKTAQPLENVSMLNGLHDAAYTQGFLQGIEPHASRQGIAWSPAIRDATLAMLGGQLQASDWLLQQPKNAIIAMNIARGFHHAHLLAGSGFCPINGLALVAHAHPDKRIMVVDCDEHGGNGTEEFAAVLPNLYNVSVFGTRFGCRGGTRSWAFHITHRQGFSAYMQALLKTADLVQNIQPDMLIYQAGADCHQADPKSLLKLSTRELFLRDLFVFQLARRMQIPTLFVVAGGYQQAERVARLNSNTVRAARFAWLSATSSPR